MSNENDNGNNISKISSANTSTNTNKAKDKQMTVGIVGGGSGGSTFYRIINDCSAAKVVYICDVNANAPLMLNAKQRGIKTITDLNEALDTKVDLIIEATGVLKVEKILRDRFPPGTDTKIIDSGSAQFFVKIMEDFFGETAEVDTQKDRYLSFKIGNENYGAEIAYVSEINSTTATTPLPSAATYFKGVINLRGRIIPIIDLANLMGLTDHKNSEISCNVIVNVNGRPYGLLVDQMNGVVDVPDENITRSTDLLSSKNQSFLKGIGKVDGEVIIIINLEQLMKDKQELSEVNLSKFMTTSSSTAAA